MRKLKVYLDTSVISHLLQEDVPEKMADTRQLWEMFKNGKYNVCLSAVTLREASEVARQIINTGILTEKSFDDCQHIGVAVVNDCDCIISWNFKHIVNIKTIRGVRSITNLQGYKPIEIWSPSVLLESEE